MTRELKPCPFCNYALSMSEGICPAQDCTDEDTGKWTFTGICCPSCAAFLPKQDESSSVPHGVAAWNTRAVPDVPELVRYEPEADYNHPHKYAIATMKEQKFGEYVRHDQADAVIAAEQAKTKDALELADRMDGFAKKYLRHMQNAEQRAETAEAKLAQSEKQEAICWRWRPKGGSVWFYDPKIEWLDEQDVALIDKEPVYTAPVASDADLRADTIEQCRKAVRNAILRMPPEHRANGDICDDVIARALAALNPSETRT